jgi:hypothetical protein
MKRSINLPEGLFLILLYLRLSNQQHYSWLIVFCPLIYDGLLGLTKVVLIQLGKSQTFEAWAVKLFVKIHYFFALRKIKKDFKVKK